MITTWKKHCPFYTEQQPGLRQAWRKGWFFRKEHGPGRPANAVKLPVLYPAWLDGYFKADEHRQEAEPEARQ